MAVQDHLKIAAGELLRAANALRVEIDQLRSQESAAKVQRGQEITQLGVQLSMAQRHASQSDDPSVRVEAEQHVRELTTRISDAKRALNDESKHISNMIRAKEAEISAIQSQAQAIAP